MRRTRLAYLSCTPDSWTHNISGRMAFRYGNPELAGGPCPLPLARRPRARAAGQRDAVNRTATQ
ncbi:hypothetical protein ACQB60_22980, partial [Actinomycetota bacterium Odt1-20B]